MGCTMELIIVWMVSVGRESRWGDILVAQSPAFGKEGRMRDL